MKLTFPVTDIQIEISNRCNLRCPLCPNGRSEIKRQKMDISLSFFKEIINDIRIYDPRIQLWNYGEPLLHPRILDILKEIPMSFTRCELSTNGHIMSEKIAEALVSSGVTEVIFAIDGLTQETYEIYRRGGNLTRVLKNLNLLVSKRNKYNFDTKITVQFIAFKHNFREIPFLGEFFLPRGVDEIRVKSAMLMVNGDEKKLIEVAKKYLYLNYPGERYSVKDGHFVVKGNKLDYCPVIGKSLTITTDERLLICCWDYNGEYEIIDKSKFEYLKNIINSNQTPEMCQKCPIRFQQTFSWSWNKVLG